MTEQIRISLSGSLDITQVESLQATLAHGLEQGHPILMHAEQVERVDAAALQLLCAFVRAAEVAGLDCAWSEVPAVLREAARVTGLDGCLALPQAA